MKRTAFTLLLSLLSMHALAADVSMEKASAVAGHFLKVPASSLSCERSAQRASGRDGLASQPAYYVFNNPEGGWVIIAADDRVVPVLAYSTDGSFNSDDMPENVRYWMDGVAGIIDCVRTEGLEAPAEVSAGWSSLQAGRSVLSDPVVLETAHWDQGSPYNDLCPIPVNSNRHANTGCVATAMAIVMRYNKWPEYGTGTVGGYRTDSHNMFIPAYSIDDHHYDWDSMPLSYDSKSSDYARSQVATIMLDCGMSVEMDYTFSGSGAWTFDVTEAMRTHFSYQSVQYVDRSSYQPAEWFSIMKNEIDAGRVVLYSGQTGSEGHMFVCDGYDTDGSMLHVNWGWSGMYDGFFALDMSVSGLKMSFDKYQSAVIGITAGGTADRPADFRPVTMSDSRGLYIGSHSSLQKDGTVTITTGALANVSDFNCSLYAKVCLMDMNGDTIQQIGYPTLVMLAPNEIVRLTFTDRVRVQPGMTDCFKLFITGACGEWIPVEYDTYFRALEQSVCCGISPDPLILIADDCHASDEVTLKLDGGRTPVRSVVWYVNGQAYSEPTLTLPHGRTEIRADVEYCDDSAGSIFKTVVAE